MTVIDVVGALSESKNPRDYGYRLKKSEMDNCIDLSSNCRQLKLKANACKIFLNVPGMWKVSPSIK